MPKFDFFPRMAMSLVNIRWLGHRTRAVQAVFRIEPKMNKLEARRRRATGRARAIGDAAAAGPRVPREDLRPARAQGHDGELHGQAEAHHGQAEDVPLRATKLQARDRHLRRRRDRLLAR
mmetsp:Transcript_15999/g.55280  ORF Transcript_15999/g.55280 Transcript_15999/m.55280 type:complete len:120 (+) Transcript_15999:110-469(+)